MKRKKAKFHDNIFNCGKKLFKTLKKEINELILKYELDKIKNENGFYEKILNHPFVISELNKLVKTYYDNFRDCLNDEDDGFVIDRVVLTVYTQFIDTLIMKYEESGILNRRRGAVRLKLFKHFIKNDETLRESIFKFLSLIILKLRTIITKPDIKKMLKKIYNYDVNINNGDVVTQQVIYDDIINRIFKFGLTSNINYMEVMKFKYFIYTIFKNQYKDIMMGKLSKPLKRAQLIETKNKNIKLIKSEKNFLEDIDYNFINKKYENLYFFDIEDIQDIVYQNKKKVNVNLNNLNIISNEGINYGKRKIR